MPYKDPIKAREYKKAWLARHRAARRVYDREYKRRWRLANPELAKEKADKWKQENTDKLKVYQKRAEEKRNKSDAGQVATRKASRKSYRDGHKEQLRASVKRWQRANIEYVREWWRVNAQHRRGASGAFTLPQWQSRVEFYGKRCAYCACSDKALTIDHVIPIVAGGANWAANLVPACRKCNCRKQTKRWRPKQPSPKGVLP